MVKRVVRWLSATTIVAMGFVLGAGCKGAVQPPNACAFPPRASVAVMPAPLVVRKGVYVDPEFNSDAKLAIANAMLDWSQRTSGVVQWDIKDKLTQAEVGNGTKGVCSNTLIITADEEDSLLVQKVEKELGGRAAAFTLLLCEVKMTVLVNGRAESAQHFQSIVEHELGHYLGLLDSDVQGSIMYHSSDKVGKCAGPSDVEAFCGAWKCDAAKMSPCQ